MEQFIGKWKLIASKNLKNYLNALGVEEELNAVAHVARPRLTICQEGDTVSINFESAVFSEQASFKLGEEFQQKTWFGRDCKVVVSLEGDQLIQVSTWNASESTTVYEIQDGQLIKTLTYRDAVAVSTYEKA